MVRSGFPNFLDGVRAQGNCVLYGRALSRGFFHCRFSFFPSAAET
jgi:hypothetical protein